MGVKASEFVFNYQILSRLTGLNVNSLQQDRSRGRLNPDDLWSVCLYLAARVSPQKRLELLQAAFNPLGPNPPLKRRGKGTKAK